MASVSVDDLSCSICYEIFKFPVVLSCTHSFCRACLQKWWRKNELHTCPLCKRTSATDPPVSLVLKTLCESFLKVKDQKASSASEHLCSLHNEKLKLFCLEHQQPVCVVCSDSLIHSSHNFRPIDEAAQDGRLELKAYLKKLKDHVKLFEGFGEGIDQAGKYIKVQARHTERQIGKEFKKLHRFLYEEEAARVTALREEEEQRIERMRERSEAVSREIAALKHSTRAIEEQLSSDPVSFLLTYKAAVERVQQYPLLEDPQLDSEVPIDVAKHLNNVSFTVWTKMKEIVSHSLPLVDQNTGNQQLTVCEDLTSVTPIETQQLPDSPERFYMLVAYLGSEGFNSGIHSWDVEVGDNPNWALGVLTESARETEIIQSGFVGLMLFQGKYTAIFCAQSMDLRVKKKPHRIRVHLDWINGKLYFFDPDSNAHIHTFTHTFTERLFPIIRSWNETVRP